MPIRYKILDQVPVKSKKPQVTITRQKVMELYKELEEDKDNRILGFILDIERLKK